MLLIPYYNNISWYEGPYFLRFDIINTMFLVYKPKNGQTVHDLLVYMYVYIYIYTHRLTTLNDTLDGCTTGKQPGGRSQTCFGVFYLLQIPLDSIGFHWIPLDSMEKPTWKGCSDAVTSRREVVVTYISSRLHVHCWTHVCHWFAKFRHFNVVFLKKKGSQLKNIEKHGTNGPNMWKTWVFRCLWLVVHQDFSNPGRGQCLKISQQSSGKPLW